MTVKPENTFRRAVHRYLDPLAVHNEKMANPYSSGTADDWYSGKPQGNAPWPTRDLWIEWKFIVVPARDNTLIDLVGGKKPMLSHLQQQWLRDRHNEGRNVWVGVGSAEGGVILTDPRQWEQPFPAQWFRAKVISRQELAARIGSFVQGRST